MTGASFAATPTTSVVGRAALQRPSDAADQRAVADRHDDRGRGASAAGPGSRRRSRRSRRTASARRRPRRTEAPLSAAKRLPSSLATSRSCPIRRISAPSASMSASLASDAPAGRVDDRAQPDAPARPGDGGAVIAGRRGDDGGRAARLVLLDRRQRAAPLEGAELVHVLALQVDRRGRARAPRRPLERRRAASSGHGSRLPPSSTSARFPPTARASRLAPQAPGERPEERARPEVDGDDDERGSTSSQATTAWPKVAPSDAIVPNGSALPIATSCSREKRMRGAPKILSPSRMNGKIRRSCSGYDDQLIVWMIGWFSRSAHAARKRQDRRHADDRE